MDRGRVGRGKEGKEVENCMEERITGRKGCGVVRRRG